MRVDYENECMKAVQECGFQVNKEELTRALTYDRNQYSNGYADGYRSCLEAVKCVLLNQGIDTGFIDGIVEQVKMRGDLYS